jgi:hypothetical protein
MAYWKEWKSLIGGGIGFLILGVIMLVLSMINQGRYSGGSSGISGQFNWYGILFLIVGIVMFILGYILRKKPETQ